MKLESHNHLQLPSLASEFISLPRLKAGDKVAVVSPSFAAPGRWPEVYELGLTRLRQVFELEPIELGCTRKIGASAEERSSDLIEAFQRTDIKAVIASLGGNDQVTYVNNLPVEPFKNNPKPFFGYSDNTHFINHLWKCRVPAFYGGALFTEFALNGYMDDFTVQYLRKALFEGGTQLLAMSPEFSDEGLNWDNPNLLSQRRRYQSNDGWKWDNNISTRGVTWGGCLESIADMFAHNVSFPSLDEFSQIVLYFETSEEIPDAEYVRDVLCKLGTRGILQKLRGVLVGRPKAWEFGKEASDDQKVVYKKEQELAIRSEIRKFNKEIPIIQNLDFGHTAPQICLPSGKLVTIDAEKLQILIDF